MGEDGEMHNGSYFCPRRVLAARPGGRNPRKQPRRSRLKRENKIIRKKWLILCEEWISIWSNREGTRWYRYCSPGAQG